MAYEVQHRKFFIAYPQPNWLGDANLYFTSLVRFVTLAARFAISLAIFYGWIRYLSNMGSGLNHDQT